MEFSFGTQQWVPAESYSSVGQANDEEYPEVTKSESYSEDFALGLHAPKRFDRILPINECLLQHDVANQV